MPLEYYYEIQNVMNKLRSIPLDPVLPELPASSLNREAIAEHEQPKCPDDCKLKLFLLWTVALVRKKNID